MLQTIFKIILVLLAVRLVGGLFGRLRRPSPKTGGTAPEPKDEAYRDLTPYDIEDADYEELPRNRD